MAERYEIMGKIGSGGVGAVYVAMDTFLDRKVAIKRLLPAEESESPELAKGSLQKETAALSALQHPNIVTIFDVGEDEDGQFVVMELITGENIEEAVERETFGLDGFVDFAGQTLDALAAAQQLDLLHRDIKPRNLMVSWGAGGKPLAKILDFGLAKFSPKPAMQTMDHNKAVLGSVFYMAPEQFERRPLDRRTDLYSLGSVFFYALSGHDPFDGKTAVEVMNAHLEHRVHHIKEFRTDVPDALGDWIMWMMNREMHDRPESAEEALRALLALKKSGFSGVNAAELSASVVQTAPRKMVPATAVAPAGKRRALISTATGSVMERDATTGLVPDVGAGRLTRPPAIVPAQQVKKSTGNTPAKPTTGSTRLSLPAKGATGATALTPPLGTKKATAATATGMTAVAGGIDGATGGNRVLIWFGLGSAGLALVAVVAVLIASSVGTEKGLEENAGLAAADMGDGEYVEWELPEKKPPKWVPAPGGGGGDDVFAKKNWFGNPVPEPGGAATIPKETNRTIHRVNGPIQLTVAGKLTVESYYDVIGFGKSDGGLKVEPGAEVTVGKKNKSKLVIGRLSSGWVEVMGTLKVASDLEIGDTEGTKASLKVQGGTVNAANLFTGPGAWEVVVEQGGELLIPGQTDFQKGRGSITLKGGGLLRTGKTMGLNRGGCDVTLEMGGRIQYTGDNAEQLMKSWIKAGALNSPAPLEVRKVKVDGNAYFEVTTKTK